MSISVPAGVGAPPLNTHTLYITCWAKAATQLPSLKPPYAYVTLPPMPYITITKSRSTSNALAKNQSQAVMIHNT